MTDLKNFMKIVEWGAGPSLETWAETETQAEIFCREAWEMAGRRGIDLHLDPVSPYRVAVLWTEAHDADLVDALNERAVRLGVRLD